MRVARMNADSPVRRIHCQTQDSLFDLCAECSDDLARIELQLAITILRDLFLGKRFDIYGLSPSVGWSDRIGKTTDIWKD